MAITKLTTPVTPNGAIDKINEIIDNFPSSGGGGDGTVTTWYGTCGTTASTTEKAVTCEDFELVKGAIIAILFTTGNTAASPTLNVNSLGAKSIYIGSSTPSSTTNAFKWSANTLLTFMYDGTYFRYMGAESAGSVIPSEGAGSWYGTSSSAATASAKTSSITNYILTQGARVTVTFSNANTNVAGAITLNVNSTGAKTIYYNNAATSATNTLTWTAGESLTFIYSGTYYYFVSRSKPLANVGTVVSSNNSADVTIPTSTATAVTSVTLDPGKWIIVGKVRFASNATGARRINISTTSGAGDIQFQISAGSAVQLNLQTTVIEEVTESTTYYLNAWQNSGGDLSCTANLGKIDAIRIA